MQFKYRETKIKVGQKEYTVCIPEYKFNNLFVNTKYSGVPSAVVYSNKKDLEELSKAIYFSAQAKKSILYIPCKKTLPEKLESKISFRNQCLNLLLMHHNTQIKRKLWKDIRSSLHKNTFTNHTYKIDKGQAIHSNYNTFRMSENKDYIDTNINFSTLFLTGSKLVFDRLAKDCFEMSLGEYNPRFWDHFHLEYMMRANKKSNQYNEDIIFVMLELNEA